MAGWGAGVRWALSWRASPYGARIADRHYNRQKIGARQFVPPGSCIVFVATTGVALWVTSWPLAEYVKHEWAGAWINSTFRNEGAGLSSELIREAVAATLFAWGDPPELGMVTFVDPAKVRRKRDPGRCYLRAGFRLVGRTKEAGLLAFRLSPGDMPIADPAVGSQAPLFSEAPA